MYVSAGALPALPGAHIHPTQARGDMDHAAFTPSQRMTAVA
jgi:hypothetical protein